jgi:hypothetical protein
MTDDATMRHRLQLVAAYRELRRNVQRSGRDNIFYACLMGALAYVAFAAGGPQFVLYFYGALIAAELLIGLIKWVFPSAECELLDALILLAFAGHQGWMQWLRVQNGLKLDTTGVFFGLLFLFFAYTRVSHYLKLRKLFAERPTAEQIAWFDDLVAEIRTSEPELDQLALDLPTNPYWKAKLLGRVAFFVAVRGGAVWVAGPDDFELIPLKPDPATGHRRAVIRMHGYESPEFDLDPASMANYERWLATLPPRGTA